MPTKQTGTPRLQTRALSWEELEVFGGCCLSLWILWCLIGGCAIAVIATGNLSGQPGIIFIESLELKGCGVDGRLSYDHCSSLQSQGEGVGSEIEKCHAHPLCPTLLWPMRSFTAGHREAKALAVIKEGFPGPWDKQEHPVLKKDSLCAFSVGRDIAQGQSLSGASMGSADQAALPGPASA